jgi:hypothetical protein
MKEIVNEELDWIDEESPELMTDLLEWMELALLPLRQPKTPVPELKTLDELKNYMETDMESWSEMLQARGKAEGIILGEVLGEVKGEVKGKADVILLLIEQKFGALSEAIRTRIRSADSEHLLLWAQRILTAKRLDEIFEVR